MLSYNSAQGLADIVRDLERQMFGTRCFSFATLAIGSNAAKVKTTSAVDYCISGVMYTKAATDDLFVHADVTVQPDLSTRLYLLSLNYAGTALVSPGNLYTVDVAGAETTSYGTAKLPPVPSGYCPIGYIKVVTSGGTFTPGTTSHAGAGVTTTYVNLASIPLSV